MILKEFGKLLAPKTRAYSTSIVLKTKQLHPKELSPLHSSLYSKRVCPSVQVSSAAPATFLLTLSLCPRTLPRSRAVTRSPSPSSRWWEKRREQTWLWGFSPPLSLPWPGVTERQVRREMPCCSPLARKEEGSALSGISIAESVLLGS